MDKKTKIVLIFSLVAIVVLIGVFLLNQRVPLTQEEEQEKEEQGTPQTSEEETASQPQYPNNLIEGRVKVVNIEGKSLTIEAKTSLIETAEKETMEKIIKFTQETEWQIYNITSQEEFALEFSEIEIDDSIVVATIESTFEKVNELEEFTAAKIIKMIAE